MDRRWILLRTFGPGSLPGLAIREWLRLLRDNRFRISPGCLLRAGSISCCSLVNSAAGMLEKRRFGPQIENTTVAAPLFVLGHWRTGTTFLHQLFAVDPRFASPNLYQVLFPHTFLSTETIATRLSWPLLPSDRSFDNVHQHYQMAYEDELALATLTLRSPYLSYVFPRQADYYDRFLTFRDVSEQDIDIWRAGLLFFLKKLTWKHGKPLILKSPPHTCRIRLLLSLFPGAKFVHIHRNPYTVFQSSMHLAAQGLPLTRLQSTDGIDWQGRTLRTYKQMYDAFLEERQLIPAGHFHEVCFEELERDPLGVVRRVYEALSLPDFREVESALRQYVLSLAGYRKNVFPELPADSRERIKREWGRFFEEWGYAS